MTWFGQTSKVALIRSALAQPYESELLLGSFLGTSQHPTTRFILESLGHHRIRKTSCPGPDIRLPFTI